MTTLRARLFKRAGEATARPARATVRSWEILKCMMKVEQVVLKMERLVGLGNGKGIQILLKLLLELCLSE